MRHESSSSLPKKLWQAIRPMTAPRGDSAARGGAAVRSGDGFERLVRRMKHRHKIRVRKWRSGTTGCAWQVMYGDGRVVRMIEAPYPRGSVSAAVFLHEVAHHAIGFDRYKPRCLEEYMAWKWALEMMDAHEIPITPQLQRRVDQSLRYAVSKARRRGLKRLPVELVKYAK
jgi:hypothetical protein